METTIALYSHDSVGLGHARRNRALAYALADQLPALLGGPVRGLLLAGHPDAGRDPLPEGWDWLILPGLTRGPAGLVPRRLGLATDQLRDLRSATIDAALRVLDPDLFIVDRHPFGMDGELRPVLRNLRDRGCVTVLGLREVLDAPRVAASEWAQLGDAEHIAEHLDAVWIYGDDRVYDPRLTGELPEPLARIAVATGYLGRGRPPARPLPAGRAQPVPPPPFVLTVLGGGSDGAQLARLAARAELPSGHRHLLITGPQMPAEDIEAVRRLAADTSADTTVARSAHDVPELIAEAAAVVCMGGYNTLAEVMVTSTPALVVPRNRRRQEQPRRAQALAAAGAIDTVPADSLTAACITAWWQEAVTTRTSRDGIDLDGLAIVPQRAADLITAARYRRPSNHPAPSLEMNQHAL